MRSPFQNIVYVQIRKKWLGVKVLTWSGKLFEWEGSAEVFIARDRRGREVVVDPTTARASGDLQGRWFTAFDHPRTVINGFDDTAKVLINCMSQSGYRGGKAKPLFLLHLREYWEGGLSDVEQRSLVSLARAAGAGEVRFVDDPVELAPPRIIELSKMKVKP